MYVRMQSRDLDLWRVFWGKSQTRAPSLGSECQPSNHITLDGEITETNPPTAWMKGEGWREDKWKSSKHAATNCSVWLLQSSVCSFMRMPLGAWAHLVV